jgi:hypothetical protein
VAEFRKKGFSVSVRGRGRKLAPSDGWETELSAVARRVVEDEQEDAAEDEAGVLEEDLSDEEADVGGTGSGQRGVEDRVAGTASQRM